VDVLGLAGSGVGQANQSVDQGVDVVAQEERVGGLAELSEGRLAGRIQDGGGAQAVEGRLGAVIGAGQGAVGSATLVLQAHNGVEEVVQEPHAVVDLIEQVGLGDGVQPGEADVAADEGAVLLLDEGVVILAERAGAGKGQAGNRLLPVGEQEAIEELVAIIRMQLDDGERQAGQDAGKAILHDGVAPPQDGHPLAPAGSNVDQLQGVDVLAVGAISAVMNQIDFEVARIRQVAGQASGGDLASEGIGRRRPGASQSGQVPVAAHPLDHAPDRRDTDPPEAVQQVRGQDDLAVAGQGLGHADQGRLQAFGAGEIQAAGDQAHGALHLRPIAPPPLPGTGLALQLAVQPPDQALPMPMGDPFGFVQHRTALSASGPQVGRLDQAEILQALRQGHFVGIGHGSLSVAISFEGTVPLR